MPSNNQSRKSKSAETTFEIIEGLRELDGGRPTEIADHLDMPKSTVHRYLVTLEDLEYLNKEGDVYHLSHRFLDLGEYTRTWRDEYDLIKQTVEEIAEESEERIQFIVEEHGKGVYLFRESGEHGVRTDSRVGKRIHLHSTAAGKAILSQFDETKVDRIIDEHGLPELTENTITERDALMENLGKTRGRGYSIAREENTERLRAFGVPVMDGNERVLGAISVSGPTNRLARNGHERNITELLQGAVNELELNIAYL